ncbi:hypothetical protein ACFQ9H_19435 [Streptomyces sp. NPDC056517]|uniref:hypothetical protein n=1 Tax=Streptomyces sp. NPDC056517 TaxID=3345848 RepID=UPI0036C2FE6C
MTEHPHLLTRIIPASAPLPERPPGPDDIPPWRAPAPAHPSAHPDPDLPRTPPNPDTHPAHPKHDSRRTRRTRRMNKRRPAREVETPAGPLLQDRRLRWAAFNGSAAAAGHLALWSITGDPMAGAGFMARMTISVPELAAAGLTAGALMAGWKGAALVQLHRIPGVAGLAARPVAAVGAALWGQGTAPLVRDALYAIEPWGTILAPLLAVGPLAAAMWWGLDRRAAAAQLPGPVRWLSRIPLATTAVSSLLYAPGALL